MAASQQPRDLWDVLQTLTVLSQPDVEASNEVLDAFQTPPSDDIPLSDGVSLPNLHHTGVYFWNNATTLWNKFQWG